MRGYKAIVCKGENVQVSRRGNVSVNGKPYPVRLNSQGYQIVNVGGKRLLVHRLVAQAFLNNGNELPNGSVVHHRDYNKSNNTASNLVICTNHAEHQRYHDLVKNLIPYLINTKRYKEAEQAMRTA